MVSCAGCSTTSTASSRGFGTPTRRSSGASADRSPRGQRRLPPGRLIGHAPAMHWLQVYDPTGNVILSTLLAALPVVVLLGSLAFLKLQAHIAAIVGLASALAVAILAFGMPVKLAAMTAVFGAAYGLLPIGW